MPANLPKTTSTLYEQYHTTLNSGVLTRPQSLRLLVITIFIVSVFCALMMPSVSRSWFGGSTISPPSTGHQWHGPTIVAEHTFSVLKPLDIYNEELVEARSKAPPVYQPPLLSSRTSMITTLDSVLHSMPELMKMRKNMIQWADSIFKRYILVDSIIQTKSPYALLWYGNHSYAKVLHDQLLLVDTVVRSFTRSLLNVDDFDSVAVTLLGTIRKYCTAHFHRTQTNEQQRLTALSILRTLGTVFPGDTVVAHGEIITPQVLAKINSYSRFSVDERTPAQFIREFATGLIHSMLLAGILWLFLAFVRVEYIQNHRTLVVVAILLVLSCTASWSSTLINVRIAPEYLVIIPAFAMVLTLLYDVYLALVFATTAVLFHIAIRSGDITSGIGLLIAATLGSLSLQRIQSRYQLIRAIGFVALGFAVWLILIVLENGANISELIAPSIASAINAAISPLVIYGILYAVDTAFNIPTDLRLFELDTLAHPLLEELREHAPGTYQHTLNVAALAENAAHLVGANPLLTRVGAYFHDVGKIRKAEYFAENQIEVENKHQHMSPKQSAAIIRSHVDDGIELAKEYKLPPNVIDFIPAHHGTSLIRHFYALALDESSLAGDQPSQEDYRYRGPKPRTKETGIVMLADSAEAAARVVDSKEALEYRLIEIFQEKIEDGQLDECPLSLKEIASIRNLFVSLLFGMHHQRPQYRTIEPNQNKET